MLLQPVDAAGPHLLDEAVHDLDAGQVALVHRAVERLSGERLLVDRAVGIAVEEAAELVLELVDALDRAGHERPREVLVRQPLAAFDRVHEVPLDRVALRQRDVVAALDHPRAAALAEQALDRDRDVERGIRRACACSAAKSPAPPAPRISRSVRCRFMRSPGRVDMDQESVRNSADRDVSVAQVGDNGDEADAYAMAQFRGALRHCHAGSALDDLRADRVAVRQRRAGRRLPAGEHRARDGDRSARVARPRGVRAGADPAGVAHGGSRASRPWTEVAAAARARRARRPLRADGRRSGRGLVVATARGHDLALFGLALPRSSARIARSPAPR